MLFRSTQAAAMVPSSRSSASPATSACPLTRSSGSRGSCCPDPLPLATTSIAGASAGAAPVLYCSFSSSRPSPRMPSPPSPSTMSRSRWPSSTLPPARLVSSKAGFTRLLHPRLPAGVPRLAAVQQRHRPVFPCNERGVQLLALTQAAASACLPSTT